MGERHPGTDARTPWKARAEPVPSPCPTVSARAVAHAPEATPPPDLTRR